MTSTLMVIMTPARLRVHGQDPLRPTHRSGQSAPKQHRPGSPTALRPFPLLKKLLVATDLDASPFVMFSVLTLSFRQVSLALQ